MKERDPSDLINSQFSSERKFARLKRLEDLPIMPIVSEIRYLSPLQEVNVDNDNIDVHVRLDDGRVFSLVVATPNNIFWCMANEG
jgi:hypothetical protein